MSATLPIEPSRRTVIRIATIAGQMGFTFDFPVQNAQDLAVRKAPAAYPDMWGAALSYENGDYEVAGVGSAGGGTMTLAMGVALGDLVQISGDASIERTSSTTRGGAFRSSAIDADFDRLTIIAQEARRDLDDVADQVLDLAQMDIAASVEQAAVDADRSEAAAIRSEAAASVPLVTADRYGCRDTVGFDNAAAWASMRSTLPAGSTVKIRRLDSGVYRFGSGGCDLSGLTLDVDEGVSLAGPINMAMNISVVRPVRVDYDDGTICFTYWIGAFPTSRNKPPISHLPDPDVSRKYIVGASMWYPEKLPVWDTDDVWVADATTAVADANVAWPDLATDGAMRAAFTSAWGEIGYRELTWSFDGATSANAVIGAAIKCSQGWIVISCLGDDGTMVINTRPTGGPTTTVTLPQWWGRATNQSWLPRMAVWTLRPLGPYEVALALNGVIIKRLTTAAVGWVREIGPCAYGVVTGPTNIAAARATIIESDRCTLGQRVGLLVMGDSKTDAVSETSSPSRYPFAWPDVAASLLDGSNGVRVSHLVNLAEAGAVIAEQYTKMLAFLETPAAADITHAIIALGANNIQYNTAFSAVYATATAMIADLKSRGISATVVVPDEFYPRTLAAAVTGEPLQGQPLTVYQIGAPIRTALRQAAIDASALGYDVGLVDGTRAIGLELAEWLGGGYYTAPRLADNIHGADLYAATLGHAVARELLRLMAPRIPADVVGLPVAPGDMSAGFTVGANLVFCYARRHVRLFGDITKTAGAWSDAVPLTIPRCFRSASTFRTPMDDGAGNPVTAVGHGTGSGVNWGALQTFISTNPPALSFNVSWVVDR